MRYSISQLLPQSGVLGVPCVPITRNPQSAEDRESQNTGTPFHVKSVQCVPDTVPEHRKHLEEKKVFPENVNEINNRTPRTPYFVQDFIDEIEERVAIMEYDGGLSRLEAEEKATAIFNNFFLYEDF